MSFSAVKITSKLSKCIRQPILMYTRTIVTNRGTNKLLLKQNESDQLSSQSDNQLLTRRTYATYREYENRQIWQCPRERNNRWNYESCDAFMSLKDWDLYESRAQTEGTCRERIPFRDPPNSCCQQMLMPHCPLLKRLSCDPACIQPHCIKRDPPYRSYSECQEFVKKFPKDKHQCDYCPVSNLYLPLAPKLQPPSDCTSWNRDLSHEKKYKWAPYSSHCYRKRRYLTCFWPKLQANQGIPSCNSPQYL